VQHSVLTTSCFSPRLTSRLQVNKEVFTEEFCAAKGWSDWDRRSWQDLTRKPSIILTDMPQYFQVSGRGLRRADNALSSTLLLPRFIFFLVLPIRNQNIQVDPLPPQMNEKPHSAVNITMQLIQLEQEKAAATAVTASGSSGRGGSNRNQPAMDR